MRPNEDISDAKQIYTLSHPLHAVTQLSIKLVNFLPVGIFSVLYTALNEQS